jgi:hypothetical protein
MHVVEGKYIIVDLKKPDFNNTVYVVLNMIAWLSQCDRLGFRQGRLPWRGAACIGCGAMGYAGANVIANNSKG